MIDPVRGNYRCHPGDLKRGDKRLPLTDRKIPDPGSAAFLIRHDMTGALLRILFQCPFSQPHFFCHLTDLIFSCTLSQLNKITVAGLSESFLHPDRSVALLATCFTSHFQRS